MAIRVLLVGMSSFDSGKTQVAIQLSKALSADNYSIEYFKPLSGHNYWYNYDHTKVCLDKRILVSMDTMRVREFINPKSPIELANPIHTLFVPMRMEKPLENLTSSLGLSGSSSILTMMRFSRPTDSSIDTTILVAQRLVEEERLIIKQEEVGMLSTGAAIVQVSDLEGVQEFERVNFERHVSDSFSEVERSADVVIIESFNDSAWLWDRLDYVDVVLLVSPAHIFSYDPERFRQAVYLVSRGNLPIREVTFGRISDLLKPISRLEINLEGELSIDELEHHGISFRTGKKD